MAFAAAAAAAAAAATGASERVVPRGSNTSVAARLGCRGTVHPATMRDENSGPHTALMFGNGGHATPVVRRARSVAWHAAVSPRPGHSTLL